MTRSPDSDLTRAIHLWSRTALVSVGIWLECLLAREPLGGGRTKHVEAVCARVLTLAGELVLPVVEVTLRLHHDSRSPIRGCNVYGGFIRRHGTQHVIHYHLVECLFQI